MDFVEFEISSMRLLLHTLASVTQGRWDLSWEERVCMVLMGVSP